VSLYDEAAGTADLADSDSGRDGGTGELQARTLPIVGEARREPELAMGARVYRYDQLRARGGPQGCVHQLAYVGPGMVLVGDDLAGAVVKVEGVSGEVGVPLGATEGRGLGPVGGGPSPPRAGTGTLELVRARGTTCLVGQPRSLGDLRLLFEEYSGVLGPIGDVVLVECLASGASTSGLGGSVKELPLGGGKAAGEELVCG
jgi:hypothetical protein